MSQTLTVVSTLAGLRHAGRGSLHAGFSDGIGLVGCCKEHREGHSPIPAGVRYISAR